jgi:hypothetical protein
MSWKVGAAALGGIWDRWEPSVRRLYRPARRIEARWGHPGWEIRRVVSQLVAGYRTIRVRVFESSENVFRETDDSRDETA